MKENKYFFSVFSSGWKKKGIKRINENKFHKFIWFRGEEKLIFKVLQCNINFF